MLSPPTDRLPAASSESRKILIFEPDPEGHALEWRQGDDSYAIGGYGRPRQRQRLAQRFRCQQPDFRVAALGSDECHEMLEPFERMALRIGLEDQYLARFR